MVVKQYPILRLWLAIVLLTSLIGLVACNSTETEPSRPERLQTWLLVEPPTAPLPADRPVTVRSRTQDPEAVSHVELYAVELPSGQRNVLIRSDAAPFAQTTFTARQTFTPLQPGHYVIKVVGYNKQGQQAESDFIGFDVVETN